MSRISRIAWIVMIAAVCIISVALLGHSAFAQSERRSTVPVRVLNTPPPLPFATATPAGGAGVLMGVRGIRDVKPLEGSVQYYPVNAKLPRPTPKLSEMLKRSSGRRAIQSATGATVVLTGDANFLYLNDETLPYDATVYYLCQNMTPNTWYRYVIFPPNGAAYVPAVTSGTGPGGTIFESQANGTCTYGGNYNYAFLRLATPVPADTDPAYPGVWAVGMQRGTCSGTAPCGTFTPVAFDTVAYSVVISTLHFDTYSDSAYSVLAKDYQPGQTLYFGASGLTPTHQYAFGVVYTGGSALPCVYTLPAAAQNYNNATCFTSGAGNNVPTGIVPFSGKVQGSYTIPAGASTGTYSLELFDVTTQDMVSTQQISVQPSSVSVTLQPYNGATTGTNVNDTFATDGLLNAGGSVTAEQSVTGVNVTMNSLISGDKYSMVLSTPNGAVLTQTAIDSQTFGPPQSFTASAASQTVAFTWPLNAALYTAIGPTLTSFAPNVMTLQIYNQTTGTILASKSLQILAYQGTMQWTSPAASSETVGTTATAETVQVTNSAGTSFGLQDGDGIKTITLAPDATSGAKIVLSLAGTTATDSNGQAWTIATGANNTIVATPTTAGQFLAVNATINIPVGVAVPVNGNCKTSYCTLRTSITPFHGINPSALDVASNGLQVYGVGGTPATGAPTYAWIVGAGPGGLGTPRFPQMMYETGTQAVTTGNYAVTMNITNCGSTTNLQELKFAMPAQFDANAAGQAPTLTSVTINGTAVTGNWKLYTKATGGNRGNPLAQNEFSIGCTNANTVNGCGLPFPTAACSSTAPSPYVATVVLAWPIPQLTFPEQDITATANYQGGCATSACGMAQFAVGPVQQLINSVPSAPMNVDSTELGFYSLNGTLMTGQWSPAIVPQGIPTTSNFDFTNTPTAADPNPDYVDELVLTIPTGAAPTSITPPTNWTQNSSTVAGGNTIYTFSVCSGGPPPCGASLPTNPGASEPNALAPGATIAFKFTWGILNLPAANTYNLAWVAYGANGGAHTNSYNAPILFANTTAQVTFANAGGGDGTPTGVLPDVVTAGSQATVGSDANANYGNGFVVSVFNNGTQQITSMKLNIPAEDVLSAKPADSAHDWQLTTAYVYPGNGTAGTCSGTVAAASIVEPIAASGTAGSISLTGCTLAANATMKIYFASSAPYDQPNHFYRFNGTVSSILTANAPTQTAYTNSDTVLVVNDARLSLYIPTGATIPTGAAGGATFPATCPGCTEPSSSVIDFGTIAGTFNAGDIVNAVVNSDAQGAHGWQLYVQLASAPPTGGTFTTDVDNGTNRYAGAYYTVNQSTLVTPSTSSPGTLLSTFTGATAASTYAHTPVQNLMNVQVALPAFPGALTPGANSVTLTYTLVPN